MRLLFLVLVVLFLFSIKRSEGSRIVPEGETVVVDMTTSGRPVASGLSWETDGEDWEEGCLWMMKILNPVKQFDLPSDNSKAGLCLSCRVLRSASKFVMSEVRQKILGTQFMSLLSARHIRGFYIYSLEKLII